MEQFSFFNPVQLLAGPGSFERLAEEAAKLGHQALLVTGRSAVRKAGYLDRASLLLAQAGLECIIFDQVIPNPTDALVDRGGQLARDSGCDLVIGLGGGSAMDTAKAIAVAATHQYPIAEFIRPGKHGKARVPTADTLPIICVTTTSGTSSQLTPFAVVTVTATQEKDAIASPHIYPRVAICDPNLTAGLPPRITAATGVDVLCHSIETYINNITQPVAELFSQRAIELVVEYLPRAVADGDDAEARQMMSLADIFAGYALSNCGATVMHALEHPISALYPEVAHGEGLAALLVPYAEMMPSRAAPKLARFAELLGQDVAGLPEAEAASRAAAGVESLLDAVNLRLRLRDLNVERESLPQIVDGAMGYMSRGVTKTPGELTRHDLMALLEASY